jgi:signal transduction histidine kinase
MTFVSPHRERLSAPEGFGRENFGLDRASARDSVAAMRHGTLGSGAHRGRWAARAWLLAGLLAGVLPACGEELWRMPGPSLAHDNGGGTDVLHGAVTPQDDTSSATLYFKFTVDPLADVSVDIDTPYQAGLTLYERGQERLGVGNGLAPHAYGAFNVATQGLVWAPTTRIAGKNDYDFNFQPEAAVDRPRRGILRTFVVEVQFIPGGDDQVTVWLQPDLTPGNSKLSQQAGHVTRFEANCSFDELRLIHRGGGDGWEFSDLAVATSFDDFVAPRFWHRWWVIALSALGLSGGIAAVVVFRERALARHRIRRAESEQAVVQERTRIAQDIHDELGASLAQIGWLADLGGGGELSGSGAVEARGSFAMIAQRARTAHAALDEIVWAVNPSNDNLPQLADYLSRLADECSQAGQQRCRKEIPDSLPPVAIRAELRHNLTLVVKEVLTNTLQHSGAANVWLRLKWEAPDLEIVVEDDGCGFDPAATDELGNGLRNQRARMAKIGGALEVRSGAGLGTSTRVRLCLSPEASPPARGAAASSQAPLQPNPS